MQRRLVPDVIKEFRITTINPNTSIREAAEIMTSKNIGALVVTENEQVIGIVTERDIMRKVVAARVDADSSKVGQIMTAEPDTVGQDCMAGTALEMMVTKGYRHLPIVDEKEKPIGMVSVRDLYDAVQTGLREDLESVENYVHGSNAGYGLA